MSDLIRRVFERKIVQWALAYGAGAWLVLEVVHTLAEIWLWPPLVAQAVTVVLAVGCIGALILAWYHGEQGRQYVGGTELLMLGGLLVIAAIAVSHVARKSTLEETATTAPPITVPDDVDVRSIAVLPFASFSAGSAQDWFAAGMHEALLTALQQIGALRVTSRTSALRYRETNLLLPEVARELGVRWLVEGSVVRAQNRVRITAQLVDGPSDHQIWAEQYERDVADMLSLQTEVARAIASRVNAAITPEEDRRLSEVRRINPEAYGAYVRGLHHFDRITPADFLLSEQSFREAIALDPVFAPAYAALAVTYGIAIEYGWLPRARAGPLAEAAAGTAMRLAPGLGDSHHALARVRFHVERDFAAAEREFAALSSCSTTPMFCSGTAGC